VSCRNQAKAFAGGRDGTASALLLARYVAGAEAHQVVSYKDGDTLNLTWRNLVVERRCEQWECSRNRQHRTWDGMTA